MSSSPHPKSDGWSGSGRMRGGALGILFFVGALRVLGPKLTYLLAVFPALFFSFVSPDVPATMAYHRRVFGKRSWWKRRWLVFRHFLTFGKGLVDRMAILAGQTGYFSFTFEGEHHLREAVAAGKGVLLLTAHVGNWEVAGQLLSRLDVPVNVAGLDRERPEVRAMLNRVQARQEFRLLPLTGSPADMIPLVAALRRGEIVAMLGDRAYGGPTINVPFLGQDAPFPVGVYMIAASAEAPLVPVFSLREPRGHYHFFGFPAMNLQIPPRSERDAYLRSCASRFAESLEGIVRRDPLQWYNFYPFWDGLNREQLARMAR